MKALFSIFQPLAGIALLVFAFIQAYDLYRTTPVLFLLVCLVVTSLISLGGIGFWIWIWLDERKEAKLYKENWPSMGNK